MHDLILLAGRTEPLPQGHRVHALAATAMRSPPDFARPTLRAVSGGAEHVRLGNRRLRIDEDGYLLAGAGPDRASHYEPARGAAGLVVAFDPAAFERAARAAGVTHLFECLHPRTGEVGRRLADLAREVAALGDEAPACQERADRLLHAVLAAERRLQEREHTVPAAKASTRRELLRRVLMASDFIQSRYDQPMSLDDIARVARLSRFHLLRLFQRVHGVTPHAYLTARRLTAAQRLLAHTTLGLDEVAACTGLGSRSSLFRHLRRQHGHGPAAYRAQALGA